MAYDCEKSATVPVERCIVGWENCPGSVPIYCDCQEYVEADAKSPHKSSDDTAIIAAEHRKLDGQRTAIRRSLEQALERPTNAALQRHIDGLRGYQESVVMELLDRAGALE